jgi:hypothetical protein
MICQTTELEVLSSLLSGLGNQLSFNNDETIDGDKAKAYCNEGHRCRHIILKSKRRKCFKNKTCVKRRTRPDVWKRNEITNQKCIARNSFEVVNAIEQIFAVECWV